MVGHQDWHYLGDETNGLECDGMEEMKVSSI
jgi:hypothetical protein